MGLFSKIGYSIFGKVLEMGLDQCINEFASSSDEFNHQTAPCFDQGYALKYVDALMGELGQDNYYFEKNNIWYESQIRFEGNVFNTFVFQHYARALHVWFKVKAQTKDFYELSDFCNQLNNQDMAHQVGIIQKESGEYDFIVHTLILFTPAIGGLEYLKNNLRQLVEYSNNIANLQLPLVDEWKHSLPQSLGMNIKTADEVLFPKDPNNIWTRYVNRVVLAENDKEIHLKPIRLIANGTQIGYCDNYFIVSDKCVEDEKIIIYKDCPYVFTLQATISVSINNLDALRQGSNSWNCNTCFTLTTITWKEVAENDYRVMFRMNVVAAENGNTSTDTDVFVSYIKYIEKLYHDLSSI